MNRTKTNIKYSPIAFGALALLAAYAGVASAASPADLNSGLKSRELTFTRSDGQVILPASVGVIDSDINIKQSNVTVQKVQIEGNKIFSSEELQGLFSEILGNTYTTKQLQVVAGRINLYYRTKGYPITRTLISVDPKEKETLIINVVEAKYAKVVAKGEAAEAKRGPMRFINESIVPGFWVSGSTLERTSLLIDDQPGMKANPIVSPGEEFGTSDLTMQVERKNFYDGRIGWDNAGSRYTGANRLALDFNLNSPFLFGDRISLKARTSNENLKAGEVSYDLPLNGKGLRGEIAVGKTDYTLGADASDTNSYGESTYERIRFSYPLIRSQLQNVFLSAGFEHRKLSDYRNDEFGFNPVDEPAINSQSRTAKVVPLQVRFDRRDLLGGGGITYGALGASYGKISLDTNAALVNSNEGIAGSYQKYNFDIARIQRLPAMFSLYGRFSAQMTGSKPLDSSELITLGGPDGVRAYPTLEGAASKGQIIQTELRYTFKPDWSALAFYDIAKSRNSITVERGVNQGLVLSEKRTLSGYGLGLRQQSKSWDMDATVAWRERGGEVLSEDKDTDPKFFVRVGYKF